MTTLLSAKLLMNKLGVRMARITLNILLLPVLLQLPLMGLAEEIYGRWTAAHYDDFFWTYTNNDAGSEFGLGCGTECRWYLDAKLPCVHDRHYQVLVNTASESANLAMRCFSGEDEGRTRYVFSSKEFDKLKLTGRGQIGFAIALESGKFEVLHFSLAGIGDAMVALARSQTRGAKNPGVDL